MNEQALAKETMDLIEKKLSLVAERSRGIIPYTTNDGRFDDTSKK